MNIHQSIQHILNNSNKSVHYSLLLLTQPILYCNNNISIAHTIHSTVTHNTHNNITYRSCRRHQSNISQQSETASQSSQQHNDVRLAASHYRSHIPFKAQFITEKIKSTITTSTVPDINKTKYIHPQRHIGNKPVSHLSTAVINIPHPKKKDTGGEDAYVVEHTKNKQQINTSHIHSDSDNNNSKQSSSQQLQCPIDITVLAVFDGVGSWTIDKDINAGLFSKECANITKQLINSSNNNNIALTPLNILQQIWHTICNKKIRGGSTACILTHREHASQVQCANLGDSGFVVLRPHSVYDDNTNTYKQCLNVVFHSTFQWHYFNCPLQLGIDLDYNTEQFDQPSAADVFSVQIQVGDIIVLSTDGLFDNIDDVTFVDIVEKEWNKSNYTPQSIADALGKAAFDTSWNKMIDTPFSVLAREENILWRGGRPDDITIVVATVE